MIPCPSCSSTSLRGVMRQILITTWVLGKNRSSCLTYPTPQENAVENAGVYIWLLRNKVSHNLCCKHYSFFFFSCHHFLVSGTKTKELDTLISSPIQVNNRQLDRKLAHFLFLVVQTNTGVALFANLGHTGFRRRSGRPGNVPMKEP